MDELGSACGDFQLGLMALKGVQIPSATDVNVDALVEAYDKGEEITRGGYSKLTNEDNIATLVEQESLVSELCPLLRVLNMKLPLDCIWLCLRSHLKHAYEAAFNRPVRVELIDSYTVRMTWQ